MDIDDAGKLTSTVSEKEVKDDLFGTRLGKAHRIYGFNVLFFRKYWDHIKSDIVGIVAVIDFSK